MLFIGLVWLRRANPLYRQHECKSEASSHIVVVRPYCFQILLQNKPGLKPALMNLYQCLMQFPSRQGECRMPLHKCAVGLNSVWPLLRCRSLPQQSYALHRDPALDPRHLLQRQQSLFSVPHTRGVTRTGIQLQQLIVSFRPKQPVQKDTFKLEYVIIDEP